jgi:putative ABC transport system ATP-binding protein
MTVLDNVALPLMYSKVGHVERLERASKILDTLGLKDREYYMPNQLSGGQIQRVAIARALVNNPSLILADEPTGNLDSKTGDTIMDALKDLNDQGNTIIMVTHDPDLAKYANRVVRVVDGQVVDTPASVKRPGKRKTARGTTGKRGKP